MLVVTTRMPEKLREKLSCRSAAKGTLSSSAGAGPREERGGGAQCPEVLS